MNKFTKEDWQMLEKHLSGFAGELHHVKGKQYEYLCYLKPLSVREHRLLGHKKDMFQTDMKEMKKTVEQWKVILGDDFWYFVDKKLVYPADIF